ncbi:MAG: FMN-binding protein [Clostridia bacterium]|nr:FMN-binding protein [Clostridia bacterium]
MTNTRKSLSPIIVLFAICLVVSFLLAGVYAVTKDRIAKAEEEALLNATKQVLQTADTFTPLSQKGIEGYTGHKDGVLVGYVFINAVKGYGGSVTSIVGIDCEGRVVGVSVSAPDETPGLGANVTKESFLSQFLTKPDGYFSLGENVEAQTGATYSSRAVVDGINMALSSYRQIHQGGNADE